MNFAISSQFFLSLADNSFISVNVHPLKDVVNDDHSATKFAYGVDLDSK